MALSIKEIQDYVYENKSLVLGTVCPGKNQINKLYKVIEH